MSSDFETVAKATASRALAVAERKSSFHTVANKFTCAAHLKSTTHCTACTVGSAAEPVADQGVVTRLRLHDAGAATRDRNNRIAATARMMDPPKPPTCGRVVSMSISG